MTVSKMAKAPLLEQKGLSERGVTSTIRLIRGNYDFRR